MANALNKDFIVKHGLIVQAQGSQQSTSTTTGAIITPGGIGIGGNINVGGTANITGSLIVNGYNLQAFDDHVWYVSDGVGSDTNDGRKLESSFKTIKKALSVATVGDVVFIEAGTYTEIWPLTVPAGVTVRGAGLRAVLIQPTVGTNTQDCFLLNGECQVTDLTISNFYQPGYAFKFATGAKITTRSPYVERVSVITRGSVTTTEDPFGFASNDAGNGAYLDAGVLDPTSLEPAMLWNEVTMIVPNATGWYMTNGARAELLNGFSYFAETSIRAVAGPLGYGGVGRTKLRLGGITGTFAPGDTLNYYNNTGTLVASHTIDEVQGDYIYFDGPAYGYRTAQEVGTSTQVVFSVGTSSATATSILLADYHQFGAELRCIGSAAVFGTNGVIADGTGTNLKLIAFNLSHIGAGGDLSNDDSLVVQGNEIIEVNNGKIFYQTVDQSGNFRVGGSFLVNQQTGDISFGNANINLNTLSNVIVSDGVNSAVIEPTVITVGNLVFSGGTVQSASGNLTLQAAGAAIILNDDVRVNGAFTSTGILRVTNTSNATSTQTGSIQASGGIAAARDVWVGGNLNVVNSATLGQLSVTGDTFLVGNLYVDGGQFIVTSTNTVLADKVITLASTLTSALLAQDSGIVVGTGTGYVSMLFDGVASWRFRGSLLPNGNQNIGSLLNQWNIVYANQLYDNSNRVITSITPSAGPGIAISNLQPNGPSAFFTVTNIGVLSILAGTDTQITTATGNVTINVTATLQTVTARGSTTNQAIQITNTTSATSTTTGALRVSGGAGIGGRLYVGDRIFSAGAEVWTTATLTDNSQLTNGAGYITPQTLGNFGISSISAGTGIAVSANTGAVTVTNVGVVSLQGSAFIAVSTSTGSVQVINLGVTNITTGSGISISTSTGTVNIASVDTLQLVTQRGATTNQPIAFTSTNLSASTNSGQALLVSGGIGALALYATTVFDSGNRVLTSVTPVGGTAISISAISTSGSNTTFTVNNEGVTSLSGTTFLGVSTSTGSVTLTNLGVQTLTAGTDTSVSASTGTVTVWNNSTLQSITNRGNQTNQAIIISNATQSTSTNSGALRVSGGVGVGGNLNVGGDVTILGQLNASVVVGSISTAANVAAGTTGSIVYQSAPGRSAFIQPGSAGTVLQSNGTTATFVSTSSLYVGNAVQAEIATNQSGGSVNATTASFSGVVNVTNVSQSTSTASGALIVRGGAGIAGDVYAGALFDRSQRVVTTVVPTAGTAIGISNLISTGTTSSFAITNLGVQAASGTTYLGVSSSTGTVTFTNLGVQTVSGSSFIGVSAATGTVTLTNLGVQTLTAGTDTAVSQSTGTVTVWSTSTLQSITNRGASTNQAIFITNATESNTSTAGALVVSGGAGFARNVSVGGNLNVWGQTTFRDSVVFQGSATFVLSTNTYFTDSLLDLHVAPSGVNNRWTFDDGKDIGLRFNYYNRTLTTGTVAALYLDNTSQWLEWWDAGTGGTNNEDIWFTGTSYGSFRLGAIELRNTTNSSSTTTGALVVYGGAGIGRDLYVGGDIYSRGSAVITAQTLGQYGVAQIIAGAAIGVSPTSGTGTVTISNLGVRSITASSGIQVSTSTGTVIIQSVDTLDLVTSRGSTSSAAITINNATQSSSTTTGALVVAGGAGFGGNVSIGGTLAVTGTSVFVGDITGRITTASNILGGTAGALLYQAGAGQTQFIGIGVSGSVLTSNGSVPTYQSTQSLVVGFAQRSSTATDIAGGTIGQLLYQAGSGDTAFVGVGNAGEVLVSRGSAIPAYQNTLTLAGTVNATSTLTGAFIVSGGVGIGRDLWVGGTGYFSGSQVVTAANLGLFGVAQIVAGTAIGISPATGTGTVTVTNLGVQSLSTVTSGGLAISTSTGSVTIQSIETLQLVTQRGATTNQPISITATNVSVSTSTGQALLVSGGIGALVVRASNLFDSGNRVITNVVPVAGTGISITNVSTSNANMTFQVNNVGVTSAIGTTFLGVSAGTGAVTFTNLGVQSLTAGSGLSVSTSTGTITIQSIDTLQSVTDRGFTTTNRINVTNVTSATTTTNGAVTIAGGLGVAGDIYARNIYTNGQIVGGQTSTSTNLAGGNTGDIVYQIAPGLTGFIGIGPSGSILFSNGTTATWTASSALVSGIALTATNVAGGFAGWIPIQRANSSTSFITSGTNGQLLQMGINTATWVSTSSLFVNNSIFAVTATNIAGGTAGQLHYQSAVGVTDFVPLGNAGEILTSNGSSPPFFSNTLTLNSSIQATSTASGALQVRGGAGIGGNLWVGGVLYATVQGSINTATNIALGTAGAIPYQESPGVTRFIGIGPNGSVLFSNGSTATYLSTTSLTVGYADTTRSSNNITGGVQGSIPYQDAANTTRFIGIGAVGSVLRSNGTTATWITTSSLLVGEAFLASTATNIAAGLTGSIPYQTTAGRTAFIGIGAAGTILQSDGTTATWFSTGSLLTGVAQNINGGTRGAIPYQDTTSTTRFIAPGVTGSLLQMQASGTATFISTSSITVDRATFAFTATLAGEIAGAPAGGGELHYQAGVNDTRFLSTGTEGMILVSRPGLPQYENTLTLAGNVQATSTTTGALVVRGGVGIGGNLHVGGTLFATVQGSINTATNIAGGAAGSLVYQSAAGVTTFVGIGVAGTLLASNGSIPAYVSTTTLLVGDALRSQSVNNITGGATGSIPYQTGPNATSFIGIGQAGFLLQSNGTTATWVSTGSLVTGEALNARNISGGAANQIPYQSATSVTTFSSNFTYNGTTLAIGSGAVQAFSFLPTSATVPTNGLYLPATNSIGLASNSTRRMIISAAGLIGVGSTITPTSLLHVDGTVNIAGITTVTNTTAASSTITGAFQVAGGVGIGGRVFIGDTTNAISTVSGAMVVNGGASFNGDIWARNVYADSLDLAAYTAIMATAFG